MPLRNLARTIHSHRMIALPPASTSTNVAVKSVSSASEEAQLVAVIGPVTSISSVNDSELASGEITAAASTVLAGAEPGPNDGLVAMAADRLAKSYNATLTFARFVPDDADDATVAHEQAYLEQSCNLCSHAADTLILRGDNEHDTVIEETKKYDLLVTGTAAHRSWQNTFLKTKKDSLTKQAVCSVLLLMSPLLKLHSAVKPVAIFRVGDHLDEALVVAKAEIRSKKELFRQCASMVSTVRSDLSAQLIADALRERERAQNTAVGRGVAMPHAILDTVDRTFLVVLVLASPVDYQAHDSEPVDVVFTTIGPPGDRQAHLMLLAKLSKSAIETPLLERLRSADDARAIVDAIRESCD